MESFLPQRAVNRRSLLAGAAAACGSLTIPGVATAATAPARLPSCADMWRWVETMVCFGPRFTGSPSHRGWIDYLDRTLGSFGLTVQRFPTPLKYWNATAWALTVTDARGDRHDIPVAYYWPYSGSTPPGGVTGQLIDTGAGLGNADLTGKVVLADRPLTKINIGDLKPLVLAAKPATLLTDAAYEDYSRVYVLNQYTPDPVTAKQRGALGVISILPLTAADADGQFSPHQQHHGGVAGLQLDRAQGARLRELMKQGPVTATVTLTADTDDHATIDYLAAKLPGNGRRKGAVLVMTHTDGQNAIEENGAAAVLAMARHYTRLPRSQRDRDIYFVFSPAHMTASNAGVHPEVWLRQNPDISGQLVAAVVPEHLGTMNWTNSGGTGPWLPNGQRELLILGVGNSDSLTKVVIDELRASDLDRTVVAGPHGDLYGEATGPYLLGIPTVTAISGPNYLLQVAPDAGLHKLDPELAHSQTRLLTAITTKLLQAA